MSEARAKGDNYALGRSAAAGCRQNAQFYLWYDNAPILHPSIPTDKENLRVAELGAGTAIWMVYASRTLPPSARLDGFDISLHAAPPQEWLPKNCTLTARDMLEPIPDELIGKYDIVHVQLWVIVLTGRDPAAALKNWLKLLKPGGWITWGDFDYSKLVVIRTSESTSEDNAFMQMSEFGASVGGTRKSFLHDFWVLNIPKFFKEQGLVNVEVDNREYPTELLAYHMDTVLQAYDEICSLLHQIDPQKAQQLRDLVDKSTEQKKRVGHQLGMMTTIGQKPL